MNGMRSKHAIAYPVEVPPPSQGSEMTTEKKEALITSIGFSDSQSGDGTHRLQCAQAGSASQFHDASSVEGALRTQGAIMHSRIRIVGGIFFGVVAVMCTVIPLLLAQDRSRPFSAATLAAIARVEAEIDRIEADALARVRFGPDNQVQQIELLGKLMLFDKELSVNRNEACA